MSAPLWAWESSRAFRARAGELPLLPYSLREAIQWAHDVEVEERRGLTVGDVSRRLKQAGCAVPPGKDRPLRGCLVAFRGAGWIFLDADDPHEEKAFTLAHEVAHFLRHHLQPRQRAAAIGPDALREFDGEGAASDGERLHAALRGVALRPYAHLMHRHPAYILPEVRVAEEEADLLACELLAPEEMVRERTGRDGAEDVLVRLFGLPPEQARAYSARLFPTPRRWGLLEKLEKREKERRTP